MRADTDSFYDLKDIKEMLIIASGGEVNVQL